MIAAFRRTKNVSAEGILNIENVWKPLGGTVPDHAGELPRAHFTPAFAPGHSSLGPLDFAYRRT